MNLPLPRPVFLMALAAFGAALAACAQAQALVEEKDVRVATLGYVVDVERAGDNKYPKFVSGQSCAGCPLYQGEDADGADGGRVQHPGQESVNTLASRGTSL